MPRAKSIDSKKNAKNKKTKISNKDKKKKNIEDDTKEEEVAVLELIKLVNTVRRSKNKQKSDDAFTQIIEILSPKIKQLCYQFNIPGCSFEDVYQEAVVALRFKAIKDYDQTRSNLGPISKFDRFAMLCMRRHLSTKLKASYQNKSITLNKAQSIDQDRSSSSKSEDHLFLSDIIFQKNGDVSENIEDKEYFTVLMNRLNQKLSSFEKQVLKLYGYKYSYNEMVTILNKNLRKNKIEVKSVDNGLTRVKSKAYKIFKKMLEDEGFSQSDILKMFEK